MEGARAGLLALEHLAGELLGAKRLVGNDEVSHMRACRFAPLILRAGVRLRLRTEHVELAGVILPHARQIDRTGPQPFSVSGSPGKLLGIAVEA
jgi:hypothetical protein